MVPISQLSQIDFNLHKEKLYLNKQGTIKPTTFELTSVNDMLKAPFGVSSKFSADTKNSSLELTPNAEIENTLKALFDRLTDEAATHSEELFGKQMSKTQLEQSFSNPLRKIKKGDLLRLKVADDCPVHELKQQTEAGLQVEDVKLSSIGKGTMVTGKIRISPVWHMKRRGELDQWGVSLHADRLLTKQPDQSPQTEGDASFGGFNFIQAYCSNTTKKNIFFLVQHQTCVCFVQPNGLKCQANMKDVRSHKPGGCCHTK